jgi:hypothetical protein
VDLAGCAFGNKRATLPPIGGCQVWQPCLFTKQPGILLGLLQANLGGREEMLRVIFYDWLRGESKLGIL